MDALDAGKPLKILSPIELPPDARDPFETQFANKLFYHTKFDIINSTEPLKF